MARSDGRRFDELLKRKIIGRKNLGCLHYRQWMDSIKTRNRYAARSKRAPHEGGVRTPIMFKLPGVIQQEMNHSTLVSNIDLVPTVLKFFKR